MIERGTLPRPAGRGGDARKRSRPSAAARAHPCAGGRGVRRRWRRSASACTGSRRGRCRASASRSRGRAPRRAGWRRGCARSAPSVVEAPAIRIAPLDGALPDLRRYDLVCLTSPNGVAAAVRAHGRGGLDARALAGARDRGDRSRHRRGAARARPDRGRRARAVRRRGAGRGAGRRAGRPGARRARRRGPRRASGRAARARRRGRRRGAVRDGRRAAVGRSAGGAGRRRLRDVHLVLDGALPARGDRRPAWRCAPGL